MPTFSKESHSHWSRDALEYVQPLVPVVELGLRVNDRHRQSQDKPTGIL